MKIVCYGDSLTCCGGANGRFSDVLQDRFPGHLFVNCGVGGENVFAAEVEAFLMTHDLVEEAAVRGVPATGAAAFLGEQVEAYVVRASPALTEQALRRYAFERLPSYKVPARIHFVDALPRNPAGKVMREALGYADSIIPSMSERPATKHGDVEEFAK